MKTEKIVGIIYLSVISLMAIGIIIFAFWVNSDRVEQYTTEFNNEHCIGTIVWHNSKIVWSEFDPVYKMDKVKVKRRAEQADSVIITLKAMR